MPITIGADPEVFLADASGQIISPHALDIGTKKEPMAIPHGTIQVDGLALEFNVLPATTAEEFTRNVSLAKAELLEEVQKRLPGAQLIVRPTHTFDSAYYDSLPYAAKEVGCSPDFSVWGNDLMRPREIPDAMRQFMNVRHAGGHIHIGWTNRPITPAEPAVWQEHINLCGVIVRELDYWIGIPAAIWDKSYHRASWYGKAGLFRPKPYGVEYRTPSNMWLQQEKLSTFVFNQVISALQGIKSGRSLADPNNYGFRNARQVIEATRFQPELVYDMSTYVNSTAIYKEFYSKAAQ